MCVYIATAGSVKMCVRFNYNMSAYPERLWYSVHAGSTQYLYYTH